MNVGIQKSKKRNIRKNWLGQEKDMGTGLIQDGGFSSTQIEFKCPKESQKERSVKELVITSDH